MKKSIQYLFRRIRISLIDCKIEILTDRQHSTEVNLVLLMNDPDENPLKLELMRMYQKHIGQLKTKIKLLETKMNNLKAIR